MLRPSFPTTLRSLRLVRLAHTVLFGLLCLAMLVLWVRSYWYVEGGHFRTTPNRHVAFHGGSGRMCVWFERTRAGVGMSWNSRPNTERVSPQDPARIPIFDLASFPSMDRLYVAHWLLTVAAGAIALVPWWPRKFSTRGLLGLTTLCASLITLIAWIDRTF